MTEHRRRRILVAVSEVRRLAVTSALATGLALAGQPAAADPGYPGALAAIEAGDPATAANACAEAARSGDPDCQNVLGWLAARGVEGQGGVEAARQWFEAAAAQGHRKALANLAFMVGRGLGGPADVERAAGLYRQSRQQTPPGTAGKNSRPATEPLPTGHHDLPGARYRAAYGDLLRIRTLRTVRHDDPPFYVTDEELHMAENVVEALAERATDEGADVDILQKAVEQDLAVVLRILASGSTPYDVRRRIEVEDMLALLRKYGE